ncbi:hypothetical protein BDEG_28335 [Batrachochytrium dendrobatidis JEL423]|uniref:Uncharacterized protein n=1 Tax=Batrachochytrium dendrobatidis (strain JEL423) TaxID=403673 RepID=A0A177WZQ6_BATDL|nr:hypothetical protein BDEG_28335 [Batrachochytrium dendrobatidis JEL423]
MLLDRHLADRTKNFSSKFQAECKMIKRRICNHSSKPIFSSKLEIAECCRDITNDLDADLILVILSKAELEEQEMFINLLPINQSLRDPKTAADWILFVSVDGWDILDTLPKSNEIQ